jgi:hypothetical protein
MRGVKLFVLLTLVAMAPACGPSRKTVYPVKGRVVDYAGKPVVGATVVFHPAQPDPDDVNIPAAHVDESGAYALTTYVQGDGAPAGEYAVTIILVPPRKNPLDVPVPDRLRGRYADPNSSKIHFTVEKRDLNEVPEIRVELVTPGKAKPKVAEHE